MAALASVYLRNDLIALVSFAALVAVFIATRLFGHSEFLLVLSHLRGLGNSILGTKRENTSKSWQSAVRLQGNRQWELLWSTLTEWGEKLSLHQIRLDVNVPLIHEGFNAKWRRPRHSDLENHWELRLPLFVNSQAVGNLQIVGRSDDISATQCMECLLDLLAPFESHLFTLVTDKPDSRTVGRRMDSAANWLEKSPHAENSNAKKERLPEKHAVSQSSAFPL